MSISQQKQIDLLKKEFGELEAFVRSRDEELLKQVILEFLAQEAEIEITEGRIKELING